MSAKFVPLYGAVLSMSASALGGPIVQPVSASTSMGQFSSQYAPVYAIDQSSMDASYVPGVTDFDSFVPSTKTAPATGGSFTTWYSAQGVLTGTFTFDLGSAQDIDALGYWADPQTAGQSVLDFNMYADNDPSFAGAIFLGSYTALGNLGQSNNFGQVFSFASVTARYIRMEILSNYGSTFVTGISEAAFRTAYPMCVPDINGDGILDNGDIGAFVTLFLAGDLAVDVSGDGILDNGDISVFVQLYLAGC